MHAKDVMTVNVISVAQDSPMHEVVGLLLKYRISAVPVVDSAGKVVGIISEGDLLRPEGANAAGTKRPWWLEAVYHGQTVDYEKSKARTADAVMTRDVVTVDDDMPLNEIAGLLERHHIKRVPVTRDGRLVGIVSRANLLHALANTIIDHHEPGAEKDRRLQTLQALLRQQQADFYAGCVGLTLPILFTGPGRHPGQVAGRSPFLQPVHVMGNSDLIGQEVLVRITAAHPNSLAGTLSQERQRA